MTPDRDLGDTVKDMDYAWEWCAVYKGVVIAEGVMNGIYDSKVRVDFSPPRRRLRCV